MKIENYNVAEIFEIAEQIERNGAAFYRAAAEKFSDPEIKDFLSEMASDEDEHEKTFIAMKKALVGKPALDGKDPDDTALMYIRSLAGKYVFEKTEVPEFLKKDDPALDEVLDYAMAAEKNSMIFYLALKAITDGCEDKQVIQRLIDEEQKHLEKLISSPLNRGG